MDTPPPKTAIFGATGLVGRRLFDAYRRFHSDLLGTDWQGRGGLPRLDLATPEILPPGLVESGHTWAVVAAVGSRDFGFCERHGKYARRRNVVGTLELARRLADLGLKVVFLSSDAVFNGDTGGYADDAPLSPINEYGRQKAEVERQLPRVTRGRCLILRLGRVIGVRKGDGTFLDDMAKRLISGRRVDAAHDQVFTPVLLDDLPGALAALQAADASGVFNIAGSEAWARLAIAKRLAESLGVAGGVIRSISLDDLGGDVPRPKNLSLQCRRLGLILRREVTPLSRCLDVMAANYRKAEGGIPS